MNDYISIPSMIDEVLTSDERDLLGLSFPWHLTASEESPCLLILGIDWVPIEEL